MGRTPCLRRPSTRSCERSTDEEDARGIPMSVRERCEKALGELRAKLRAKRHAGPSGQILLDMGAIDQGVLAKALEEQPAEGAGRSWARCW